MEETEESTIGSLGISEFEKMNNLAGVSVEVDRFDLSTLIGNAESSDNGDVSFFVEISLLGFVNSYDTVSATARSWSEIGSSAPTWSLLITVEVPVAISADEGLVWSTALIE
jgi:hypothetical protein